MPICVGGLLFGGWAGLLARWLACLRALQVELESQGDLGLIFSEAGLSSKRVTQRLGTLINIPCASWSGNLIMS